MQRIFLSFVLGLVLVGTADAQRGGGKTKYSVDVTVSGSGLVTSSTGGISCPGTCSTSVNSGTAITFTATPDQGATFTGWGGDCAATSTTCSLTITAPTSVSATFEGGGGGGGSPTITEVYFDTVSSPATLTAIGTNFDVSTTATLGANTLTLDGTNGSAYTAFLPSPLSDGDYLLTLTNAAGSATWQLTYPAVGPEGPPGQPGADGVNGTDGADGTSCSVSPQTGGALISCDDGSTAALADGQNGSNGSNGADGKDGAPGTSCSVTQQTGGALISCEDGSTAALADGQNGSTGPTGPPGELAAGTVAGEMLYWNGSSWQLISPPAGNKAGFLQFCNGAPRWNCAREIVTGRDFACALHDGGITCWGGELFSQGRPIPDLANPRSLDAGGDHACVVHDGGLSCFGFNSNDNELDPPNLDSPFKVSAGSKTSCALHLGGLTCWGHEYIQNALPTLSNPTTISGGGANACALHDGGVVCWGYPFFGIINVPALSNPIQVSVGYKVACALDDSGVICWGSDPSLLSVPELSNPKQISVGEEFACVLDDNGITCWGNNQWGQLNVPLLTNPTQVSAGGTNACAIHDDGIMCWGGEPCAECADIGFDQSDVPEFLR